MSRPKKNDQPPAHYPQGPQSITFSALEEDDWWALLHALEQRIRFFQEQRSSILRLNDAGLDRQLGYYNETIERLDHLIRSAQQQLSSAFFNPRASGR